MALYAEGIRIVREMEAMINIESGNVEGSKALLSLILQKQLMMPAVPHKEYWLVGSFHYWIGMTILFFSRAQLSSSPSLPLWLIFHQQWCWKLIRPFHFTQQQFQLSVAVHLFAVEELQSGVAFSSYHHFHVYFHSVFITHYSFTLEVSISWCLHNP